MSEVVEGRGSRGGFLLNGQVNWLDNTSNNLYLAQVQLEVGSLTEFEHISEGEELALCQRYYFEPQSFNSSGRYGIWQGATTNAKSYNTTIYFPVSMRAHPSVVTTTTPTDHNFDATSGNAVTMTEQSVRVYYTANGTDNDSYYYFSITATAEL